MYQSLYKMSWHQWFANMSACQYVTKYGHKGVHFLWFQRLERVILIDTHRTYCYT